MTSLNLWAAGARPRTLPAAIAPVIVGSAFASRDFSATRSLLALIVALALQIGVNYANDYSDGIKGTDSDRVGPLRLVGSGVASARSVRNAAFISFLIAALAGLYLASLTSWSLLLIGAAAIIAAWNYTGGSKPYGYSGFGEISVFIFFGIVATLGTYYVNALYLSKEAFLASLAMGSLACSILVLNNLRDREKDELVNKRTLAVIIGDAKTRDLYRWLMFAALTLSALLSFFSPFYLLALLSLPLVARSVRQVASGAQGVELISLLGQTGRIQMIYAALLSLAAVLANR